MRYNFCSSLDLSYKGLACQPFADKYFIKSDMWTCTEVFVRDVCLIYKTASTKRNGRGPSSLLSDRNWQKPAAVIMLRKVRISSICFPRLFIEKKTKPLKPAQSSSCPVTSTIETFFFCRVWLALYSCGAALLRTYLFFEVMRVMCVNDP